MALCPCHSDGTHSLSVGIGDNGKVIIECLTGGCHWLAVVAKLGLKPADLWPDDDEPAPKIKPKHASPTSDQWAAWNAQYVANLTKYPSAGPLLLQALSLPEAVLPLFPELGARLDHPQGACWTHPERGEDGSIVGISLRFKDGAKEAAVGGTRGVCVPPDWQNRPGALYLPEGLSDTMALTLAGLAAVGRPGNCQKLKLVARYIENHVPPDRAIVWLGENDQKSDGKWPGRDASTAAMKKVAEMTGRQLVFHLPPAGAKDARAWFVKSVVGKLTWEEAGKLFAESLGKNSQGARVELADLNEVATNDLVIEALVGDPDLFTRINSIVRVVQRPAKEIKKCQFPPAPQIAPVSVATLRERISSRVDFVAKRNKEDVHVRPPDWCVKAVRDRKVWPGMRNLEAVVDYPVLRPDGSLIITPGYDDETGVFYSPVGEPPVLPEAIDRDAALEAWEFIKGAISDFPFHDADVHRSCWLASLLTPMSRFAFRGPVPLFLIDGNAPGAGKGLLADVVAITLTGREFAVTTLSSEDEEMRKRITAIAIEGDRLVLLDNIAGSLGGSVIDAMLTSVEWDDRILSTNTKIKMPLWATWYATGNNVELVGDIPRRICPIRLETSEEKPEERTNFKHPKLRQWVKANRGKLLAAALTILVAYQKAGRPPVAMKEWGGYEGWSDYVRAAIVWLGLPDPAKAKEEVKGGSHVVVSAMETILRDWEALSPSGDGMTCNQIISTLFPKFGDTPPKLADLAEAVGSMLNRLNGQALAYKFRQFRGRVRSKRYLDHDGSHGGTMRWAVFCSNTRRVIGPKKQLGDGGDEGVVQANAGKDKKDDPISSLSKQHHHPHHPNPIAPKGTGFAALDD